MMLQAEAVLARYTNGVQRIIKRGKYAGQGEKRIILLVRREGQTRAGGELVAETLAGLEKESGILRVSERDAASEVDDCFIVLRVAQDFGGDGRVVLGGQVDAEQEQAPCADGRGVAQQIGPTNQARRHFQEASHIADESRLRPGVFGSMGAQQQEQIRGMQRGDLAAEEKPALEAWRQGEAIRGRQKRLMDLDGNRSTGGCEMDFVARAEISFPLPGIGR